MCGPESISDCAGLNEMGGRMKNALGLLAALAVALVLAASVPRMRTAGYWQQFVAPGPLSTAHGFLQGDCSNCHVSIEGVQAARCISCHANETALLQRQPTAFHSNIGTCVECHREHEGDAPLRSAMDHDALATIGLRQLARAPEGSEARLLYSHLFAHTPAGSARPGAAGFANTPPEQLLDCYGCHQSRDRHVDQFGRECGSCHSTAQWTIPEYRHPPPSSTDCAQCHRAPPSHSMGHFEMVSKRVAGVEHAEVSQCYLCHQTTSWNDIKSVGMYDHH